MTTKAEILARYMAVLEQQGRDLWPIDRCMTQQEALKFLSDLQTAMEQSVQALKDRINRGDA